ncbi:ATP-binding cassette domain-containing protein [Spiribacter sp. 221]|uniref:ABC transporter ATP-binding protein n=1 Tax=Spiribacter onubensis TaxID=3122420 RepID=UPI00349F3D7B
MTDSAVIEVSDLRHSYSSVEALRGVSFSVPRGSFFALLGPNGAGKTTLVHALCTLLRPSAGHVAVAGLDVRRAPRDVRRTLGLVFQEPSLDDRLTVFENLVFHARIYQVPRRQRRERAWAVLELVELQEWANAPAGNLSRGMKRRLEIGRAMLHEPSLVVLDEPTTGLDVQSRRRVWEYLERLQRDYGVTLLLTTHQISEAEGADLVAIIDRGELQALDCPSTLRQRIGRKLINLQIRDESFRQSLSERFTGRCTQRDTVIQIEADDPDELLRELVADEERWTMVDSLEIVDPSLEDVFINLTGRELRDRTADGMR